MSDAWQAFSIPCIQTPRFILRGYRPADFEAYAAAHADPEVMRLIADGKPQTEEEAWSGFLNIAGLWQMAGFGCWAVEEKSSGQVVGTVGFQDRKRERGLELRGVPEAGWVFARSVWGEGYATEALNAALVWGRDHFGPVRVIAIITPDNAASIRVAEKCGFKPRGPIVSAGRNRLLFERLL